VILWSTPTAEPARSFTADFQSAEDRSVVRGFHVLIVVYVGRIRRSVADATAVEHVDVVKVEIENVFSF